MTTLPSFRARPVVAGVDGSDASLAAALYAAEEADRRGLPLLLVHATPWSVGGSAPDLGFGRLLEESAEELLRNAESQVRDRTGATQVRTAVLDDYPVPALSSLSAEAALLVLGRRGVSGTPGILAGSTASGVVQHARCPLVVLPEAPPSVSDGAPVVVGVEGRPDDEQVLALALAEAAGRRRGLLAVHAWRDVPLEAAVGGFGTFVDRAGVEEEERRLLAETVAGWRDKEPDVGIIERVVRERPARALLDAAAGASLLVVGHRHRPALARLGSTVHGLLHRAPCPLAVVPIGEVAP
jgi:nucleotide-binding universal stress UspA family protein